MAPTPTIPAALLGLPPCGLLAPRDDDGSDGDSDLGGHLDAVLQDRRGTRKFPRDRNAIGPTPPHLADDPPAVSSPVRAFASSRRIRKRLERIGSELSGTNQKLLAAVSRIAALIINAVPPDFRGSNLGMNYCVTQEEGMYEAGFEFKSYSYLYLVRRRDWIRLRAGFAIKFSGKGACAGAAEGISLRVAHQFASDVANGLLGRICNKLDPCLARTTHELDALEQGEILLKKNLS